MDQHQGELWAAVLVHNASVRFVLGTYGAAGVM